jgi:predicted transcriptional regulator
MPKTVFNSRTADKFVVRLPDGMRSEIEAAAGSLDSSMNTIFIQAMRQFLDNSNRQQLLLDALAEAVEQAKLKAVA